MIRTRRGGLRMQLKMRSQSEADVIPHLADKDSSIVWERSKGRRRKADAKTDLER